MHPNHVLAAVTAIAIAAPMALAGDLTPPPGIVAPTMKPLDQVEPRTPVNTLPAGVDSIHLIDQPGSYYLTGNITGAVGMNGIRISADNVSLDLNGFVITGVAGSGHGVIALSVNGLVLGNGSVVGFTMRGIEAASARSAVFDTLIVRDSGDKGIAAGFDSVLRGCIATGNGSDGIFTNTGALVVRCIANSNSGDGFDISVGCSLIDCIADNNAGSGYFIIKDVSVDGCLARNNGSHGLDAGAGTTVRGCHLRRNGDRGIRAGSGCVLIGNHCDENVGPGISAAGQCLVSENSCASNGFFGGDAAGILIEGARNRVHANTVIANDRGIEVTAIDNVITSNVASGNGVNYVILAGNDTAPITSAAVAISPLANTEN